ncbi:phosphatase PAP2 family protein [Nocardia spumae]|uniref:phosphatase PAP2 family protein n=1 Tax=Nocardia spumae TaxID=2887190 RepID=UPI001D13A516|nr:phosphatase PAP2 family protein [Nocardia spumae]
MAATTISGPVAQLPARARGWFREAALVVVVYFAYDGARLLVGSGLDHARTDGHGLLRLESWLGLDPELWLNRIFSGHAGIAIPADFAYATLHYVVTPAVLIWMWWSHREHYRLARTQLGIATVAGLVGFVLMPTAPPRLLESSYGFVDVMALHSSVGWWQGDASTPRGLDSLTNSFAAMPSLHVGWALWCGLVLYRFGRNPSTRLIGVAYPIVMTLVVMGTANHYLLDCVAGAALILAAGYAAAPYLRICDAAADGARVWWSMVGADAHWPAWRSAVIAAFAPGALTGPAVSIGAGLAPGLRALPGAGGRFGAGLAVPDERSAGFPQRRSA